VIKITKRNDNPNVTLADILFEEPKTFPENEVDDYFTKIMSK